MRPKNNKINTLKTAFFIILVCFYINPILGLVSLIVAIILLTRNKNFLGDLSLNLLEQATKMNSGLIKNQETLNLTDLPKIDSGLDEPVSSNFTETAKIELPSIISTQTKLNKRKKYLHIALNNSMAEARNIIRQLPSSDRILIEVGTPMIKNYGISAIEQIKSLAPAGTYIVADNKCADLAAREVQMMAEAGANASTCLGVAPIETIDNFILECEKYNINSMIDMMNVEDSLAVLKKLKKLPDVVILHRGVDETESAKGKQIPLYQIKQIKGSYNLIVAVAGGDTIKEIQSALFNGADIVVVWKNFYQADADTAKLANDFLREIQ